MNSEPTSPIAPETPVADAIDVSAAPDAVTASAPHGTEEFLAALCRLLRDRPLTAFELTEAVETTWPGFLDGRRGFVHAALLQLRRSGAVTTACRETPAGRRRLFTAAASTSRGAPALTVSDANDPPSDVATDLPAAGLEDAPVVLQTAADKMVRGLKFAPQLQDDVRRDILDHLVDAARATTDGAPISEADADDVLRHFGDQWRIRTDLKRSAEGRRTVLFPRGIAETLAGLAIYDATILLGIVGVIIFVRLQMLTAYHIPTRSMEPTLHGDRRNGDRILVNRLSGPPERFDVYVFDGWGSERKNYVKRCVGLPNETLQLRQGDVYVNGELVRKEGRIYEALLFRLYHWDDVWKRARADNPESLEAAHDQVFDEQTELWENVVGRWELSSMTGYTAKQPAAGEDARLRWRDIVNDDLYDAATGDYEGGFYPCPDLRVAADITLSDADSTVVIRLSRGAATYDAVISVGKVAVFTEGEEVASAEVPNITVDAPTRVLFSQVDRVLRLEMGDLRLRHDLPQPSFPKRESQASVVEFRVRDGAATIKPISIERDIFYTPENYASNDVYELGPNDFFMLGDNSGNSQDSRRNGAVHRSRLVGKPILIVWPPARWRDPATSPHPAPR